MAAGIEEVFGRVMERVKSARPTVVRGWFRALEPFSFDAGSLCIRVQNAAQKEYLERFTDNAFTSAAQEVTGRLITVAFEVDEDGQQKLANQDTSSLLRSTRLDSTRTWESFAVGACNRLAHAAANAVLENPDVGYNPLFIWGGKGVGKTHLLCALADRAGKTLTSRDNEPSATPASSRLWYLSTPMLIDQIIESIEKDRLDLFKSAASNLNLVVLDDVHLFADRQRSQEEFFHLFNRLLQTHTQVVLSANQPPKDLVGFSERLTSRFAAGLVAGMDPPCIETRTNIVRLHAQARCIELPEPIAIELARRIDDPQVLIEALVRLDSLSHMQGTSITASLLEEALCTSE